MIYKCATVLRNLILFLPKGNRLLMRKNQRLKNCEMRHNKYDTDTSQEHNIYF